MWLRKFDVYWILSKEISIFLGLTIYMCFLYLPAWNCFLIELKFSHVGHLSFFSKICLIYDVFYLFLNILYTCKYFQSFFLCFISSFYKNILGRLFKISLVFYFIALLENKCWPFNLVIFIYLKHEIIETNEKKNILSIYLLYIPIKASLFPTSPLHPTLINSSPHYPPLL